MDNSAMDKQTITLDNGTRIAYLHRPGGDMPLVLLHGITDNARTYEPLMAGISPRCTVYALDFRGHGDSDKPESVYDAESYADDVRHFITEVIGAPVFLQGHSLGGVVAVQVGTTAPELIAGLLLEDPPLYFVNNLDETYQTLFEGIVVMATTLQDGSQSKQEWFDIMANAPDPFSGLPGIEVMGAERINLRLDSISMMKPKALQDALAGSLEWETDAVLNSLQRPLSLITGNPELGAVMSAEEVARVTALVADSQATELPDVGHLIHDQKPDTWLAAVNAWIEGAA